MSIEKGGFDLHFNIPDLASDSYIEIRTNVNITSGSTVSDTIIRMANSEDAGKYVAVYDENHTLWEKYCFSGIDPRKIRYCMHNEFLSVYVNESWLHTFYFQNVNYPEYEDFELSILSSGSSIVATDIVITDLYDWREAIFIDLDTAGANAISSVIQQRPVEIRPTHLGEVRFQYSADDKRDIVDVYQKLVVSSVKQKDDSMVISDAIVYGPEVEVLTSEDSASKHGFITKIIRVPELDTGARRAAKEIMKRAEQQSVMYTLTIRSDLRIEIGDIVQCTYHLSGTNTEVVISCIIESIQISVKNAIFSMVLTGREYDST